MLSPALHAEPYLAVQQGYKCMSCHFSPTGGGLRNAFGNIFAQNVFAARHIDVGQEPWTGAINRYVALGGDLRGGWSATDVPGEPKTSEFDVTDARVYLGVEPIPGRLALYVDERVAPGTASNLEAYARYATASGRWLVRAGRFYLPFGLRLEDDTAFTRQVPGINMTTPDTGVELGYESERWSAQLAVSNGSGGGPETDTEKQFTGQLAYVDPRWRLGAAASYNSSDAGDRGAYALFGGLRTGPVVWLGEVDFVVDEGFPEGTRHLVSALLEANWQVRQGHNLKLTVEAYEPDRDVDEDEQARWSAVYEYSPMQFLQLRGGVRYYDGIPQNDLQNRRFYFVEVHGYF
jgi:hypothetical protein